VGTRVVVDGLDKAAQYNGLTGTVTSKLEGGRVCVVFDDLGKKISVNPANAAPISGDDEWSNKGGVLEGEIAGAFRQYKKMEKCLQAQDYRGALVHETKALTYIAKVEMVHSPHHSTQTYQSVISLLLPILGVLYFNLH